MNWKYNPIIGLILLIIIAVIVGYHYLLSKKTPQNRFYSVMLICENHDPPLIFHADIPKNNQSPFQCPECGKKSAYPALKCYYCSKIFPMVEEVLYCPDCKSANVKPLEENDSIPFGYTVR